MKRGSGTFVWALITLAAACGKKNGGSDPSLRPVSDPPTINFDGQWKGPIEASINGGPRLECTGTFFLKQLRNYFEISRVEYDCPNGAWEEAKAIGFTIADSTTPNAKTADLIYGNSRLGSINLDNSAVFAAFQWFGTAYRFSFKLGGDNKLRVEEYQLKVDGRSYIDVSSGTLSHP